MEPQNTPPTPNLTTPPTIQNPPVPTNNKSDKLYGSRSIYDATGWEIIWKNFVAGMMRGLGSVLIWFIFTSIIFNIILAIFWPRLRPYFEQYFDALSTLGDLQTAPTTGINSIDVQELLRSIQSTQP